MKTRKQVVSLVRFRDIINTASRLALGKIRGTLPKKDARVDALRNSVRALGETDREILRRDVRHLAVAGEFVRDIGEHQYDLTPLMPSFTFGPLEKDFVLALRRLVKTTGVQVQWVTRDEALVDDEGNPTVAALGEAARAMLDNATASSTTSPASEAGATADDEDDFVAHLERENSLDQSRSEDEAALTLVREWYMKTGRFAPKGENKPAGGQAPTTDKNAPAVARATELAAAGKGTVETASLPLAVSNVEPATDDVLEVEPMADVDVYGGVSDGAKVVPEPVAEPPATDNVEPTLEEEWEALYMRMDEILTGASKLRGSARQAVEDSLVNLDASIVKIGGLIKERDRQAAEASSARAAEAERIEREAEAAEVAAQAAAEAALEPEDVHIPVGAPAPVVVANPGFEALKVLARGGNARAQKLVASVAIDGSRTEAEAVELAHVVGLI